MLSSRSGIKLCVMRLPIPNQYSTIWINKLTYKFLTLASLIPVSVFSIPKVIDVQYKVRLLELHLCEFCIEMRSLLVLFLISIVGKVKKYALGAVHFQGCYYFVIQPQIAWHIVYRETLFTFCRVKGHIHISETTLNKFLI